jgi:hypothetical protein
VCAWTIFSAPWPPADSVATRKEAERRVEYAESLRQLRKEQHQRFHDALVESAAKTVPGKLEPESSAGAEAEEATSTSSAGALPGTRL